jgi:hypothetical protein
MIDDGLKNKKKRKKRIGLNHQTHDPDHENKITS